MLVGGLTHLYLNSLEVYTGQFAIRNFGKSANFEHLEVG